MSLTGIGVIGGADGPTAIFVTGNPLVTVCMIAAAVLVVGGVIAVIVHHHRQ